MDWDYLYVLLAIGSIAPYLIQAATSWIAGLGKHKISAHAPIYRDTHTA